MSLDTEYVANRNGCHWTKDTWQTEGLIPEAFRGQSFCLYLSAMRCSNGLCSVKVDSEDGFLFVEQAIMSSVDLKVDLDAVIQDRIIF